jgi:hypothetical protein
MLYSNGHDYGWMDKDFMSNNYKKDTYVSPLADETCPMKSECAVTGKECVAFRGWLNDGKVQDAKDVGRLLR